MKSAIVPHYLKIEDFMYILVEKVKRVVIHIKREEENKSEGGVKCENSIV